MQKSKRILLVGGGSAGHVVPNLAIASALKEKDSNLEFLYVGSRSKLDQEVVAPSGLPFKAIFTGKLRRYFSWRNFVDPFLLILGFFQSLGIMLRFKPDVVFSKGGFVSVPVVLAAALFRKRILLHEADSTMGLSNRICSRFAETICISFPNVATGKKVQFTGNPVRSSILGGSKEKGYKLTGFNAEKPVLLVWGGSLGALEVNDLLARDFDQIVSVFQVIHVTGKGKETKLEHANYKQFTYLEDELKDIYAITDMVFGRAGANSLYELALVQKPNVLLPLKINKDQELNAKYFEDHGGSIVLKDEKLFKLLNGLWQNEAQREAMKKSLKELSRPHATEELADLILS